MSDTICIGARVAYRAPGSVGRQLGTVVEPTEHTRTGYVRVRLDGEQVAQLYRVRFLTVIND